MKRWLCRLRLTWSERISTFVAVTTLFLAGSATLATFQAASYGNEALLAQTELASCWAYYQAKSIKEHSFQLHRNLLDALPPSAESDEMIRTYEDEIARYRQEKHALMQEATELTRAREEAETRAASLGEALLFLQVGILFSSLASVSRIPYYWYGSLAAGLGGLAALLSAYLHHSVT